MIIVVEGPSASGKTSWIREHSSHTAVLEESITANAPDGKGDPEKAAAFWAEVSAKRWTTATKMEEDTGLVFCDTDPFKLHYVWSLWKLGQVGVDRWLTELEATRDLFAKGRLGLADLIFVTIPDMETLRTQAELDTSRARRNFDLHSKLGEYIRLWYQAVGSTDESRVYWELPSGDLAEFTSIGQRSERSGVDVFDAVIGNLP